jgi:hypothetical protein
MKVNIFVTNDKTDVDGQYGEGISTHREARGHRSVGLIDYEEELVTMLDEQRMSPEKRRATRFLTFLGNRRLTMQKFADLSPSEQKRLKTEFLGE